MFTDIIEHNQSVYCWYRDPDDNSLVMIEDDAPYYCYRRNESKGDRKSLFGDTLSKNEFESRSKFRDYRAKRHDLFESDVSPVHKYLSDNFYQTKDTYINVGFFDIEVDYDLTLGKGYPRPENPFGKINSFSLYDVRKKEYHMVVLNETVNIKGEDGETVHVHHCVTERQLIDKFVRLIEDIDMLSAWNGDQYDIPYIIERCCIIYGEREGLSKLCRDDFAARSRLKKDDYGNEYEHFDLVGRCHVDYMELYKKFTFGERESYSLDYISTYELKKEKLKFVGDLGELYRTDPQTFFEYSLHDSRLMKLLDDKLKFINLTIAMAKQATIRFPEVLGSIRYLEQSIMNHCHFDREQPIYLPDRREAEKEPFEGAYVLETVAGGYGYTMSIDLSGLYPSTIRALNISPESYLFVCDGRHDDFVKIVEQSNDTLSMRHIPSGESVTIKGFEAYDMLREENLTISAQGCIFGSEQGILPEILELWAKQRSELQAKMRQAYKDKDQESADYYNMMQNLKKLSMNSLYGAVSNPYSRFYDIDLASSVTRSGQIIEKYQTYKADQLIQGVVNGR